MRHSKTALIRGTFWMVLHRWRNSTKPLHYPCDIVNGIGLYHHAHVAPTSLARPTTAHYKPCHWLPHLPCGLHVLYEKLPKFHNFSKFLEILNFPKMPQSCNFFSYCHGSSEIMHVVANFGLACVKSNSTNDQLSPCATDWRFWSWIPLQFTWKLGIFAQFHHGYLAIRKFSQFQPWIYPFRGSGILTPE